jgi:hypothetical protein
MGGSSVKGLSAAENGALDEEVAFKELVDCPEK